MARKRTPTRSLRNHLLVGAVMTLFLVGGIGGWAAVASISGAVIASGSVIVESNTKRVQHKEGGIVGAIMVKEGAKVEAGDVLIRLDETVTRAKLTIVSKQLDELAARKARLVAERDQRPKIEFPTDLEARRHEPDVAAAIAGEQTLFTARRESLTSQKSQLSERVKQLNEEIRGLTAQRDAKSKEVSLIENELQTFTGLHEKGLAPITKVLALAREKARLEGERGQFIADIARAKGKITETEQQLNELLQTTLVDTVKELRDVEAKVSEMVEQKVASEDQLKRIEIRSPRAGSVHQLAVHTVGGVIGAGETIMLIVPHEDRLVIETRIQPTDIDQVRIGQPALVRLAAFNQRTTPELNGTVETISADLTQDQTKQFAYYTVRIRLSEEELGRLRGLALVPGMPVDAFIQTGQRTALSYLLKPLEDQILRVFRED
jgi:HlyD family secretion protein